MSAPLRPISRRSLIQGAGSLVVSFSLPVRSGFAQQAAETPTGAAAPKLPGSLAVDPYLDSWIRLEPNEAVTVFTGKAELGQGVKTALLQVAAEELSLPVERLTIVTADTSRTPNEGYTAGSHSMQDSGAAIRNAAAQMRELLIAEAARRLNLPADELKAENGVVTAPDGRSLAYGALVGETIQHVRAQPVSKLRDPATFKVLNTPMHRVDIPAKVTGGAAYVQDMRLPGMLHARVVRPPSYGAQLRSADIEGAAKTPGVVKVIRDGNFLAVVATREFQAIKAMRTLAASAEWDETAKLPTHGDLADVIVALPSRDLKILDNHQPSGPAVTTLEASYSRPYQSHGSIGPSCAVAQLVDGVVSVWTHTQGVYPDRAAIAEMLRLPPDKVRCIHVEGSGCYGHNGADDAAADAALIAAAMPGTPIRLQWMREQEHAWEPFGPAMVTKVSAGLDAIGRVADWRYEVWSNTHSMRPGSAGSLLPAQHVANPFPVPPPQPLPLPEGGGDRNAIPLYVFPNAEVMHHFLPDMPLRVSAMRSLGAYMNVFTIESFMDELAFAAKADPVEFRLKHLEDSRARDVVKLAAERFGWDKRGKPENGLGYGFAFARYKNLAAYCAIAMEVETERESGRIRVKRAVSAVDAGQVVNPDGVRNQIEGAILQSSSWTLYESVSFDETRITSVDWATYPILRFHSAPDSVEVHIIDRPGLPFLGAGEAGQGPAAAAIANAVADATGQRLRELPLTAAKLKAAIGV
ncbi:MAG TPA: molybdopterin cofactor-binding domain-containing protein [Roseiarcus sp.]